MEYLVIALMFVASVVSGMLGIGVAFAAIPILGLQSADLVHEIQPVSLLLNGVTAGFSALAFARAGLVDWRAATAMSLVCIAFAPAGAYLAQFVAESVIWAFYFASVGLVIFLLLSERTPSAGAANGSRAAPFARLLVMAAPIALLSGVLGVGPGFLLVPAMILSGIGARRAAAINAVAVTPASFAALVPHAGTATVTAAFALPVVLSASAGALLGGVLASSRFPESGLRKVFVAIMVVLVAHKVAGFAMR